MTTTMEDFHASLDTLLAEDVETLHEYQSRVSNEIGRLFSPIALPGTYDKPKSAVLHTDDLGCSYIVHAADGARDTIVIGGEIVRSDNEKSTGTVGLYVIDEYDRVPIEMLSGSTGSDETAPLPVLAHANGEEHLVFIQQITQALALSHAQEVEREKEEYLLPEEVEVEQTIVGAEQALADLLNNDTSSSTLGLLHIENGEHLDQDKLDEATESLRSFMLGANAIKNTPNLYNSGQVETAQAMRSECQALKQAVVTVTRSRQELEKVREYTAKLNEQIQTLKSIAQNSNLRRGEKNE